LSFSVSGDKVEPAAFGELSQVIGGTLLGAGLGAAVGRGRDEQAAPGRIEQFRETAPCADWIGVWLLVEKYRRGTGIDGSCSARSR
jgi:hypothetical protein